MNRSVLMWGASGHARVVREALGSTARLTAIIDRADVPAPFADIPLFSGERAFDRWAAQHEGSAPYFVVAIGGANGRDRLQLHEQLVTAGLTPLTVIHPRAFVAADAECGEGSQVLAMATVCVGARIGRQTIVNTAASVDHDCQLGGGVHVAPGARLAGLVQAEDNVFIGTGAVIAPRVHLGHDSRVGAGAVVLHDVPAGTTVVGNPARPIGGKP